MSVKISDSIVENIIIKLDNGEKIEVKVSLDDWITPIKENIFRLDDAYMAYVDDLFDSKIDNNNVCVLHSENQIKQVIKNKNWDIDEFNLDMMSNYTYDYLVNNILGVRCGYYFKEESIYGVGIYIPTRKISYFKDMISIELKDSQDTSIKYGIDDYVNLISMTYDCGETKSVLSAPYFEDCEKQCVINSIGTNIVIEIHNSFIFIACSLYNNVEKFDLYMQKKIQYTNEKINMLNQRSNKMAAMIKILLEQFKKEVNDLTTQKEYKDYLNKQLFESLAKEDYECKHKLHYELVRFIDGDPKFKLLKNKKQREDYLYKVLQKPEFVALSNIPSGNEIYFYTTRKGNRKLTTKGELTLRYLQLSIDDRIDDLT